MEFTGSIWPWWRSRRFQVELIHMKYFAGRLKGLLAALVIMVIATTMLFADLSSPQMGGQPSAQAAERHGGSELQEIQQRLGQIQQQAFENNPELLEQAEELERKFLDKMKEGGYEFEKDLERLQQLQEEVAAGNVPESRLEDLTAEAEEIRMNLQERQQMAGNDDEIVEAQNRLEDDILHAMRAVDPGTDDIIARFEHLLLQVR